MKVLCFLLLVSLACLCQANVDFARGMYWSLICSVFIQKGEKVVIVSLSSEKQAWNSEKVKFNSLPKSLYATVGDLNILIRSFPICRFRKILLFFAYKLLYHRYDWCCYCFHMDKSLFSSLQLFLLPNMFVMVSIQQYFLD